MGILISIIVGAVAGWLAGIIVEGRGFGLIWNLVLGIIGGLVGQLLLTPLGLDATNILGSILVATFGAVVLITIVNLIKRN